MTPQPQPSHLKSDDGPLGGTLYRKQGLRGRWRLETAGPKWVTLRSIEVMGSHGRWVSVREPRETWPNGWERA
jgi:hypothetical protein